MILTAILSGFILAVAAPWIYRLTRGVTGWVLGLLPLALTLYFAGFIPAISAGETVAVSYPWVPSLNIEFSFYLDGLSLLFALIICGIGALIIIYSNAYMAGHGQTGRFYFYFLLFMTSMLGLVLTNNIITLLVFWELTTISSFLLIGFEHEKKAARQGAWQALLITGAGGLALLAGMLLLGLATGEWQLSTLLDRATVIQADPLYLPILVLILLGAFTKSAQFPFHIWLPSAMEAPTPVSAYLHSATMVKAGVYLLARLSPIFSGTDTWFYLVTGVGGVTMLVGGYLAPKQRDIKRILAYSTVSALGMMMLLLGLDEHLAVKAAIAFLLAHALYKGALFLIAGIIDHESGTRDVTEVSGLRRVMPLTALAAGLATLSMAGLPPFLGFVGKEHLYKASLEGQAWLPIILTGAVVLANIFYVTAAGIAGFRPFVGNKSSPSETVHSPPFSMWLGPLVLAGLGLVTGLVTSTIGRFLIAPAVTAILSHSVETELHLWQGITPALLLSGLTLGAAAVLYTQQDLLRRISPFQAVTRRGPLQWYNLTLKGINKGAQGLTGMLQHGYLRYYLLVIIATAVGLIGYTILATDQGYLPLKWTPPRFFDVAIAVLILIASLAVVRAGTRLGAVVALGVVGYGVAVFFLLFGAPDLAITQILVDTLIVVLLVLGFYHLPELRDLSSKTNRIRDAIVATILGGLTTALVLTATNLQLQQPVSDYFAKTSVPEAHGHNIVNVILVDFRVFDTLGEITVLSLVGIGLYAFVKLRPKVEE